MQLHVDGKADQGANRHLLMPAFGMLWGAWLLGEHMTLVMLAGCAFILLGTAVVFDPLRLRRGNA